MNYQSPKACPGDVVRLVVDVEGDTTVTVPRGTEGLVVEAYTEPQEGYAVDVVTRDEWDPEGPEYDNIIVGPDQFEVVPHPCTIRVDAKGSSRELADRLAEIIDGQSADHIAASDDCCFQVFVDPPLPAEARVSGFSRFRHRVEGEARPGVTVERMATVVASILEHFWAEGTGAVALCHYRHLLPRNGGLPEEGD